MRNFLFSSRRARVACWILAAVGASALIAGGLLGHAAFREWQLKRLVRKGEDSVSEGNYVEASLSIRRALQIEPGRLPAQKAMASLMEAVGDPTAVGLRGEIASVTAESADSLLAYAGAAVRFGRFPLARSILSRVSLVDQRRPEFQSLMGTLSLESDDLPKAERHFAEAVQGDPGNHRYQLQLAAARSKSDDYSVRKQGRQSLQELSNEVDVAVLALRALLKSLVETGERVQAVQVANRLVLLPGSGLSDRLGQLTLLQELAPEEFRSQLAALKEHAKASVSDARAVLIWMCSIGLSQDALNWAGSQLVAFSKLPDLQPALATCCVALEDWKELERISQSAIWGRFEYLRHAFLSRALRERGGNHLSSAEWGLALSGAGSSIEALTNLSNLANGWKWDAEEEAVLLAVAEKHPEATSAFKQLSQKYWKAKNTPSLLKLASFRLRSEPDNEDVQNDVAYLSLLLGEDIQSAVRSAEHLYKRHPRNPSYASTYALAMDSSGDPDEACRVMAGLSAASLREPPIAAVYGRFLLEKNLPGEAAPFLEISRRSSLLPEERALAEEAVLNASTDRVRKE